MTLVVNLKVILPVNLKVTQAVGVTGSKHEGALLLFGGKLEGDFGSKLEGD